MWSRLGSEVTVVEFLGQIGGPGMDAEISKATQKILTKQGLKFKLNTKVMGGEESGSGMSVQVEAAKGGKNETVSCRKLIGVATIASANANNSLTRMLSLSPLAADLTPQGWALRTSALKLMTRAVLSSTKNTAPKFHTSA